MTKIKWENIICLPLIVMYIIHAFVLESEPILTLLVQIIVVLEFRILIKLIRKNWKTLKQEFKMILE